MTNKKTTMKQKTESPQKAIELQMQKMKMRMKQVKHKIAIISGKGGVGKTTVAVNLAMAFAMHGWVDRVGVLDADIHGPCVPQMLGLKGAQLPVGPPGAFPARGPLGIKVVSMDFLIPDQKYPVIWRGPLKMAAIRQFLAEIAWGKLEYLVIDLPPGTGDEPLSVLQLLPEMDGVVIVTIPSEVSQNVVKKAVTFSKKLGVPVLGIIENMSSFTCPKCGAVIDIFKTGGGKNVAHELNVPYLGSIPIDPRICVDSDLGKPFIVKQPKAPATKSFLKIVKKIENVIKKKTNKQKKSK